MKSKPSLFVSFISLCTTLGPAILLGALTTQLQGCAVAAVSGAAATGVAMVNDRRSTGTIVEDQTNELKALKVCLENPTWKKSHISAISYNNTLLLVGQTPDEKFKQEIENELRSLAKIRDIHNELTVEEPVSLSTRSQDAWITTQIKARMFGKKDLNPARIKVVTENGIVYLLGLITEEEEAKATEIARSTSGVEKVVQIFERS